MSRWRLTPVRATVLVTLLGVLLRVPFLHRPLSSDEAGFLMIARQWSPGHSLYGNYWVDRPPLLIGIFQVAEMLGGAVGLRLVGMVALAVSAAFAAAIARQSCTVRWAPPVVAAIPAFLMCDTAYGSLEVDGELLAVPFVLAGLYAVLRGLAHPERSWPRRSCWLAAGVLAVLAASVKQSMVEVFFAAAIGLVWLLVRRSWRIAVEEAAVFVTGVALAGGAILGWAAAHGTRPGPLFDAVVTFRGAASRVISEQASSATSDRAHALFEAFLVSGAWGLGVLAALSGLLWWLHRDVAHLRGPALPLAWIAIGVAAWETFGVAAGGSYWLHYLIGTVPGSVLLTTTVLRAGMVRARWVGVVLAYVLVVAVAAVVVTAHDAEGTNMQVARYLEAHSGPGDSAVTAFGHPDLLQGTGLADPYVHLWSLPVRVRDSHLVEFTRTLVRDRPTWVIVAGPTIDTWAVDAGSANAVLARDYRYVTQFGGWYLFRARSAD